MSDNFYCEHCEKEFINNPHATDDGYWLCDPCWQGLKAETGLLVCTECPHVFTQAELDAEDKSAWGHPCHANVTDRFGPKPTTCESFRKPLKEETEQEAHLRRRRAFMPDYDKALEEWLS
jgi:hypothetical protein